MTKYWALLLGNFLEFYDFTLFAALLPIISPLLFPSPEILSSFMSGYIFLAIGFLARPLGAVLFGYIGDRYSRKKALIVAILMMSIATIGIGVLPSYDSIGSWSLAILALCRIFQGLSAGGEYCGAGLLMTENSRKENQYLNGAVLTSSGLFGAFTASIVAATVSISFFPKESWRILFLIGGCIGFITLWLRLSMVDETSSESRIAKSNRVPWVSLFTQYKLPLLCTIGFGALMNVPFYLVTGFINTYFVATGAYTKTALMFTNAAVVFLCGIAVIFFGFLSKHFHPQKMMLGASVGITLFAFPFFFLVESGSFIAFIIAELSVVLMAEFFVAPALATMVHMFPYSIRYRGIAVGGCLGLAFLGGSTPYISANLVKYTGLSWSPAFYLFAVGLLGFFSVILAMRLLAQKAGERQPGCAADSSVNSTAFAV